MHPVDCPVPFLDLTGTTREVGSAVRAAWDELLRDNQYVGGSAVERFEEGWAAYCGTAYAVGVANGTDALHLTLRALGIGAGDHVVLPANTFIATAEAVVLAGAEPRFADVDPRTLLLTPPAVEDALTPRTRAVIAVHLYGQPADMDGLAAVAARHHLALIEDAAQAHGATWCGRRTGGLSQAGCFSFYPSKNLGAFGDAGAVVTSDSALARRLRSLRNHGRDAGSHHRHTTVATNSRLDAVQAAVLSIKLAHLDRWNAARRAAAARYQTALRAAGVRLVDEAADATAVYHLFVARVARRAPARRALAELGVGTEVHYPTPCHLATPYARYAHAPLPNAERAAREVLSLPMFPHLTDEQLAQVCAVAPILAAHDADSPSLHDVPEAIHA